MKGMGSKLLALLLTGALLLALYIPSRAAESGGFIYEVISGSAGVRITGYTANDEHVVIPGTLGGRTVVEISASAFAGNAAIREVTVSSNVQRIMRSAFQGCTSLERAYIPASVSAVGDSAFAGCTSLTSLEITSASTSIGYYAFEGCTSLASVTIPSARIGYAAFRGCTSLLNITLPDSVQSIGRYAFDSTAWYNSQSRGLMILGGAVYSYTGSATLVELPENVSLIADYAFSGSAVERVIIPEGVYYIGNQAFYDCGAMTYLSVPRSVISLGTRAVGYTREGLSADFTLYCYSDTAAMSWGESNGVTVFAIDDCTHDFGEWETAQSPTCTDEGVQTRSCIRCNSVEEETVPATGHTWSGWVTISTLSCTTDNVLRRTCTICGETEDSVTLAPGHSWEAWIVTTAATCTENGERSHTCSVCSQQETELIEATGHLWIVDDNTDSEGWSITAAPTCTEAGSRERACSVDGTVETEELEPTGHVAHEWTVLKDPTAIETGLREGVCETCGETFTQDIPVIEEELPDSVTTLTLKDGSSLTFDIARTCVTGVKTSTTVAALLNEFNYSGHILVTAVSQEESQIEMTPLDNDAIVGTGCFIFLVRLNVVTQQYDPVDMMCVIVKGDVNGDGVVTAGDARTTLRASAGLTSLNTASTLAADLNGDGSPSAAEARTILRVASKLESF